MKFLFLSLLVFSTLNLFSQDIDTRNKCYFYDYTAHVSKTDKDMIWKEETVLTMLGDIAVFESYQNHLYEKEMNAMRAKKGTTQEVGNVPGDLPKKQFGFIIKRDYNKKVSIYSDKVYTKYFRYYEQIETQNWSIHKQTRKIQGFVCQLATIELWGKKYEAWFTEDIPLREGPYKFHGLPGLIVELSDEKKEHHFILSRIDNGCEYSLIEKNSSVYMTMTREEFLKVRNKAYQNYRKHITDSGITIGFSEEQWREVNLEKQKISNLLEME
jgi:GLPGLI family protein